VVFTLSALSALPADNIERLRGQSQRSILIAMAGKGQCPDSALVKDEPVLIHCYTTPEDIQDLANLAELGRFCRRLGREAKQGEVGLVVGDEYFALRQFEEV
jgi:hypothetical protein